VLPVEGAAPRTFAPGGKNPRVATWFCIFAYSSLFHQTVAKKEQQTTKEIK